MCVCVCVQEVHVATQQCGGGRGSHLAMFCCPSCYVYYGQTRSGRQCRWVGLADETSGWGWQMRLVGGAGR